MDAHIGTAMTLEKVSRQCMRKPEISVDNARGLCQVGAQPVHQKNQKWKKTSEEGCYERKEEPTDKENTMLKVLESMSRKNRRFRENS